MISDSTLNRLDRVLKDPSISDLERVDHVSSVIRSVMKGNIDPKLLVHIAGNVIHELLRNSISSFRDYVPLSLSIYKGLTGADNIFYMGLVPGRISGNHDREIKPTLVRKASVSNDFIWGAGEIFEDERLLELSPDGNMAVIVPETLREGISSLCGINIKDNNTLSIPLFIKRTGAKSKEPYGFIIASKDKGSFSETEKALLRQITSYFSSHIQNFEILRKDQLTQFYNQQQKEDLFITEISKAVQNRYCVGLLLLDIDDFKLFNDRFGHLNGDSLLAQFGRLILDNIRPYDRAIRIGGEEFMIITPKVDGERLQGLADRIRLTIEDHKFNDRFGNPAYKGITASFGALLLEDIENKVANTEFYFEAADKNLYAAKRNGKNRVEFSKC
ncbi:MAG: GGDEF domain-containing protein [Nitrospirota bacterium]|nr:MAG: GGDEF domain-containing protein [Nitrospirota bacterium]